MSSIFALLISVFKSDEQDEEVLRFVEFWKERTGKLPEELIFDSRLTTDRHLNRLNQMGIDFITLRRRSAQMLRKIYQEPVSAWRRIELQGLSLIYKTPRILDRQIQMQLSVESRPDFGPGLKVLHKEAPPAEADDWAELEATLGNASLATSRPGPGRQGAGPAQRAGRGHLPGAALRTGAHRPGQPRHHGVAGPGHGPVPPGPRVYSGRQKLVTFSLPDEYLALSNDTWDAGYEVRIYFKEPGKALRFMNITKTDIFKK